MPKRGAVALLLTTGALALLLSFKTPTDVPTPSGAIVAAGGSTPAPPASSQPVAGATPAAGSGEATPPAGIPQPSTAPTPGATPAPTGSTAYRNGTVDGAVVGTRWGPVQVQVTISGGVITDVAALQLPSGDRHSLDISRRVEPVLRSAALAAQSARIDVLSGATYTSTAYAQSLQAALDAARA